MLRETEILMTFNVAILGASGYTGAELVRIIATHPSLRIAALSADRKAGQQMADVFPHLRHLSLPTLSTIEQIDLGAMDLIFCALPHGLSQALVRDLPRTVKVVSFYHQKSCAHFVQQPLIKKLRFQILIMKLLSLLIAHRRYQLRKVNGVCRVSTD
jgi:hypothetical protein